MFESRDASDDGHKATEIEQLELDKLALPQLEPIPLAMSDISVSDVGNDATDSDPSRQQDAL